MTDHSARLERVAEAIWRAERPEESAAHTWEQCLYPKFYRHLAQASIDALQLTEEWGATCDQWSGGRMVRSTREEAEADAAIATERDRGAYSSLEPPPPSIDDMRIEIRSVSPWAVAP